MMDLRSARTAVWGARVLMCHGLGSRARLPVRDTLFTEPDLRIFVGPDLTSG
ncbi:MAG: hypothetical protein GDA36_11795 [Rhodobacteraceae bacterium]|nr:hypothetical protein [Paracoccaceae bacterium]